MDRLFSSSNMESDRLDQDGPVNLRDQLKSLIDDKEKQLVLVGTLGQRFLSQQVELEERIQQMDDGTADDNERLRVGLGELAQTMKSWDSENQELWASALSLGPNITNTDGIVRNGALGNLSMSTAPSYEEDMSTPTDTGPSEAQSTRRAKNAGIQRPNTVEFATEIGNQLTREIRRVQALLSERDKALQDLKEERDDLERNLESLRAGLREREATAEKFKDENWNLEYQLQELQTKLAEAQADKQRVEFEQKRALKQLTTAREIADGHKTESERLQSALDDMRGKHETDVAQMRKTAAGLQREKSDLQTSLDGLKAEIAQKAKTLPNRFHSPVTPSDQLINEEDDIFTGGNSRRKPENIKFLSPDAEDTDSSPDVSPLKSSILVTPSHSTGEVDALKQSLAHAHRQMSALRNSVQREKEQKLDYRRRLTQQTGSSMEWEDEDSVTEESSQTSTRARSTSTRGTRGRGAARLTLAQKLGMAAAEKAFEDFDSTERFDLDNSIEDDEPSPFIASTTSRQTSVDGMDPAFANILRSLPTTMNGNLDVISPIAPRRTRGGAAFATESRPKSTVDVTPEALSAELMQSEAIRESYVPNDSHLLSDSIYGTIPVISRKGSGVQTDAPESAEPPTTFDVAVQYEDPNLATLLVIPHSSVAHTIDVGIQNSLESESRISRIVQTDPAARPPTSTASVSTVVDAPRINTGVDPVVLAMISTASQTLEYTPISEPLPTSNQKAAVPIIVEPLRAVVESTLLPVSHNVVVPRASVYGRVPTSRPVAMLFDDESEAETETESEYVDARETEPTPSSSVQDFQSFQTGGEESDAESVRTSIATSYPRPGRTRYDSIVTTQGTPIKETSDMAMQTEEWLPELGPAVSSIPFYRPGSVQTTPFQYIPSSPGRAPSSLVLAASVVKSPLRDSSGTSVVPNRSRTLSTVSNGVRRSDTAEDVTSTSTTSVDKTRPPIMFLPPPPNMPPPTTLPVKKVSMPPSRPTSPPPPELIQRATTPTFGRQSSLTVPNTRSGHLPPQVPIRQISTTSFRSANNSAIRSASRSGPPPTTFHEPGGDKRHLSQTSLLSGASVTRLRRSSVASSHSTDKMIMPGTPRTPSSNPMTSSTDPSVIHAITQTMIGEFLYKYTRRVVGKGHGEKRHKRFFWVHPYTKTLYWSSADPGASNAGESNAKSAYIDAVKQVIDPNPLPPGLHQYSIIVYTPQREMKFTAPTKERHDIWFKALSYLLDRPSAVPMSSPGNGSMPPSPLPSRVHPGSAVGEDGMLRSTNNVMASPASVRSAASHDSMDSWNLTPRARALSHLSPTSVGRRSGTPAAEYMRTYSELSYKARSGTQSPTKPVRSLQQRFEDALDHDQDDDFENVDPQFTSGEFEIHADGTVEGFEGLEDVRSCCGGRHTLAQLAQHQRQHHHHSAAIRPTSRLSNRNEPLSPSSRPVSPLSGRSRSGSQRSDGGSLFSWGANADTAGKRSLRFGSRRSNKSSTTPTF